ncbi:hypothetical protein IF2G_01729 [Cordyceps javanica]|nr:hypothetical protein IF2G_01729 [Cordyceps javanica]
MDSLVLEKNKMAWSRMVRERQAESGDVFDVIKRRHGLSFYLFALPPPGYQRMGYGM